MKREIVLDTETTGIKPEDGHRIVEIGAVELIDGVKTGKTLQMYINPEREMDSVVIAIHGITNEFVKDKPRFNEIADEFLAFIKDSILVIHNADFDIKFLNSELDRANKGKLWDYVQNVVCTLKLDRRLYAEEKKHTLDAMCNRFEIDNSNRTFHGALLDSELLAECYIRINQDYSPDEIEADLEQTNWVRPEIKRYKNLSFKVIKLTNEEEESHVSFLDGLAKKDKVTPVFSKANGLRP